MVKIKTSLAALPETFDWTMLWAACCTGFFGFLHCEELLLPGDAPFNPSLHLVRSPRQWRFDVCIKGSKTDQLHVGSSAALGATGSTLCPVASLLDYLNARGGVPGPLFICQDGTPLRHHHHRPLRKPLTSGTLPYCFKSIHTLFVALFSYTHN